MLPKLNSQYILFKICFAVVEMDLGLASLNSDSENFVKQFYIPSYILVRDEEAEHLLDVPECPVLVFINSKSGGQLGGDLLITYRSILNKYQVCKIRKESYSVGFPYKDRVFACLDHMISGF